MDTVNASTWKLHWKVGGRGILSELYMMNAPRVKARFRVWSLDVVLMLSSEFYNEFIYTSLHHKLRFLRGLYCKISGYTMKMS